jgi:hypothetical protein
MNVLYRVFGLNISSAVPLPAPPVSYYHAGRAADVVIEYGNTPETLANPRFKGVRFQASHQTFLLTVDSIARYYVENGARITITPEAGTNEDDVLIFLMGSAMGALLHQRNTLVLHAAAIRMDGGSVLFTGPSGAGKSTLAAGFHQRGHSFLADDVCAITLANEHPAVLPGFPRLKLWADVLKKMKSDKANLKKVRHATGMEKYFFPVAEVEDASFPIKAIFILTTTNTDKMEIVALKGGEKAESVIHNTYRVRFLEGLGGKKDHFKQCAALAANAAVYRVIRPKKGFLLQELMALVEERFLY